VAKVVPERIRWAVETLAVEPDDRLLDIGGGAGFAASLVCERLDRGRLFLIDRSATAIERTRRRNPQHLASGRLALETVDLADFDPGKAKFNKVFAVNVFWRTPTTEGLACIRRALVDDGQFFLFYEAPHAAWIRRPTRGSSMRSRRTASQDRSSSRAPRPAWDTLRAMPDAWRYGAFRAKPPCGGGPRSF
jgi:SAM-dependent methyltransferase